MRWSHRRGQRYCFLDASCVALIPCTVLLALRMPSSFASSFASTSRVGWTDQRSEWTRQVLPEGLCRIPMGDKCQSRYKFVPEVPEAVRTAQLWHLRYSGDFMQPSAVAVLRERASDFAPHKRDRKARSPGKRVQVAPDTSPHPPEFASGQTKRSPRDPHQQNNHPDIRPGEALVCKTSNGQVTYWALSKLVSGCEQWRQLAALPPKPPPGRGCGGGGRPPRQGILSPVPRKGVQFEARREAAGEGLASGAAFSDSVAVPANDAPPCPNVAYLPQIQQSLQQRRMQRIR